MKVKIEGSTNKEDFFNFVNEINNGKKIQMKVDNGEVWLEVI